MHNSYKNLRRGWSNTAPAANHARQWLYDNNWHVLQTDKDGGFCLIQIADYKHLLEEKLTAKCYREVDPDVPCRDIVDTFSRMIHKWGKATNNKDEAKHITWRARSVKPSKLKSQILSTIKTHKPPGEVAVRVLHSSVGNPFRAFNFVVGQVIRWRLNRLAHLCTSTDQALNIIKNTVIRTTDRFVRMDIKDFYMMGKHGLLANLASKAWPAKMRAEIESQIEFCLSNQFVESPHLPGRAWQVQEGSGMGSICSGELSDWAFFQLAEEAWATNRKVMHDHTVRLYLRYRDDIFIIVGEGWTEWYNYCKRFMQLAKMAYELKIESIDGDGCNFLDVQLFKLPSNGEFTRIGFKPFFKTSEQHMPLLPSSAHCAAIHSSWPIAEVQRLRRRSGCAAEFENAKAFIVQKFRNAGIDDEVCAVASSQPYRQPFKPKSRQVCAKSWLVLPYHPAWKRNGLVAKARALIKMWVPEIPALANFDVGVAWSRQGQNLSEAFQSTRF